MNTIPNCLTVLRAALLVPLLCCVLVAPPRGYVYGLFLLWLALITDILDGYFAARLNQRTDFGALLDALTDKILIHALLFAFLMRAALPAWLVFAMFIRDMFTDGVRNFTAGRGMVMRTFVWGKLKFGFQFAALNACFLAGILPSSSAHLHTLACLLLACALAVSLPGTVSVIRACVRSAPATPPPPTPPSPAPEPPHIT